MRLVMTLMKAFLMSAAMLCRRPLHRSRLHCSSSEMVCVSCEVERVEMCSLCSFWIIFDNRLKKLEKYHEVKRHITCLWGQRLCDLLMGSKVV